MADFRFDAIWTVRVYRSDADLWPDRLVGQSIYRPDTASLRFTSVDGRPPSLGYLCVAGREIRKNGHLSNRHVEETFWDERDLPGWLRVVIHDAFSKIWHGSVAPPEVRPDQAS